MQAFWNTISGPIEETLAFCAFFGVAIIIGHLLNVYRDR